MCDCVVLNGSLKTSYSLHKESSVKPLNTTAPTETESDTELVEEELLVEEISIDGMCGVY